MPTKKSKTKPANDTKLPTPFLSSAWQNLWELADDTRSELHKQTGGLISFVDGVLRGATGYASNLNDRSDRLAREGLLAISKGGREIAVAGQGVAQQVASSSRTSAAHVLLTTKQSARSISDRANATVRAIVTPAEAA